MECEVIACPSCGSNHSVKSNLLRMFPESFALCPACYDRRADEARRQQQQADVTASTVAQDSKVHAALRSFHLFVPAAFAMLTEAELLAGVGVSPRIEDALRWRPTRDKPWLLLAGPSGTGKTSAMWIIARGLAERGKVARVYSASEFAAEAVEAAREGFTRRMQQKLLAAPLLGFDDIEKGVLTPRAQEMLFYAINTRYEERLPTIFTTQQDWAGLRRLWPDSDHSEAGVRRMNQLSTTIACTR